MNFATINDFDVVWNIFEENKKWFPHVRKSHIRNRLSWGQVILQNNVVITQQQYKRKGKIGHDTDIITEKDDYIIHQIIAQNRDGSAAKVIKDYFDYVESDVWLTVRKENRIACRFYEKIGMENVGNINWSKGKMKGLVWKKTKN